MKRQKVFDLTYKAHENLSIRIEIFMSRLMCKVKKNQLAVTCLPQRKIQLQPFFSKNNQLAIEVYIIELFVILLVKSTPFKLHKGVCVISVQGNTIRF